MKRSRFTKGKSRMRCDWLNRYPGGRRMSPDRRVGSDLLLSKKKYGDLGVSGAQAAQDARGRERAVETDRGGPDAG